MIFSLEPFVDGGVLIYGKISLERSERVEKKIARIITEINSFQVSLLGFSPMVFGLIVYLAGESVELMIFVTFCSSLAFGIAYINLVSQKLYQRDFAWDPFLAWLVVCISFGQTIYTTVLVLIIVIIFPTSIF